MIVQTFPFSAAPRLGRWLGRALRTGSEKRTRIAAENLSRSRETLLPHLPAEILEKAFDNLGQGMVELLMTPRLLQSHRLEGLVRFEKRDVIRRLLDEGRGAILAIAHSGNYELAGIALARSGCPLTSLARPIVNRWMDRYLRRLRTSTGQRILPREAAAPGMVRVLRRNELLVVQMDLDAKDSGVHVDFMGRPMLALRSPAVLSLRVGSPIVVVDTYRAGGVHHCAFSDPIYPAPFRGLPDPTSALTQCVMERVESQVRRRPDQWMWMLDPWRSAEKAMRSLIPQTESS